VSENLDLVRALYVAWERGDYTATDWAHPEIEYVIADGPAPRSWKGLAAMAEGWRDFLSAWEGYRSAADEFRELDDERVLVLLHDTAGRGKTSGLDLGDFRGQRANVFHFRSGKVLRLEIYFDCNRALAALGLRE
jgi:ketosteroid isomerase-like protein